MTGTKGFCALALECAALAIASLSHDHRYHLLFTVARLRKWSESQRAHFRLGRIYTQIHEFMADRIKVRVVASGALGNTIHLESSTFLL